MISDKADKGTPVEPDKNKGENGEKSRLEERKIRYEIAKDIFDEVLEANLHQSEISARILIPVAFLTAATISLFKLFVDMGISVDLMGKDFTPILFILLALYVIFTVGGILIFLEVIGPSFFVEIWPKPKGKQKGPKSTLFFKYVAETNIDTWMDYLCKKESKEFFKIEELQDKLIYDYTVESSLLAKKAQGKVKDNLFAHLFFYPSFCCLLLIACIGVLSYFNALDWIILGSVVLVILIFIYIEIQVLSKYRTEAKTYRIGLGKESKKE